jgi:hypothetical protein
MNSSGVFIYILILYKVSSVTNQYKLYRNKLKVVYIEVLKDHYKS